MILAAVRRSFGPFDAGLCVIVAVLIASPVVSPGGATGRAAAQGLGPGLLSKDGDKPLEIYADEGIEWRQDDKTWIARGNARAVRGNVTVHADVLTARYRKLGKDKSKIWRVEADGHVRIKSPTATAHADKAVYDVGNAVLVLTGNNPRLVTAKQRITARDSLEYWEKKRIAVARGEALVVQKDGRLKADVLTAHFRKTAGGGTKLYRVEAFGNVLVTTPSGIARGDRGTYDADSGIATLTGSVKITRGNNQLNGEIAEINLKTGVSRILSASKPGSKSGPVRALIVPQHSPDKPSGKIKK